MFYTWSIKKIHTPQSEPVSRSACVSVVVYVYTHVRVSHHRGNMGGPAAGAERLFVWWRVTATPLPPWGRLVSVGVEFCTETNKQKQETTHF